MNALTLSEQHYKVFRFLKFIQNIIDIVIVVLSTISAIMAYSDYRDKVIFSLNIIMIVLILLENLSGIETRKIAHRKSSYAFKLVHDQLELSRYQLIMNTNANILNSIEETTPPIPSFFQKLNF